MSVGPDRAGAGEWIPPNSRLLVNALRSIGYTLPAAIADIVDNSISARAKNVVIRIIRSSTAIERVLIADDGRGMSDAELREAMRFGAETEKTLDSLSKFGMGLKLASLSQAKNLTVVSRRDGRTSGRRWTEKGLEDNWRCDILPSDEAERALDQSWDPLDLSVHGTVVEWSHLDRIKAGNVVKAIEGLRKDVSFHLGLHLHRFIEDGRLRILIENRLLGHADEDVLQHEVPAHNPFGYESSEAAQKPPLGFSVEMDGIGEVLLEGHIWNHNSQSRNYKLDGANRRQGFYFYRNDRLIQAGGWSGMREEEPHLSLARVAIDLPPTLDNEFSLDVQKSKLNLPPVFTEALQTTVAGGRTKFSEYLKKAQSTYRRQIARDPTSYPLFPWEGLPVALRQVLRQGISPDAPDARQVSIRWSEFEDGSFFHLDREEKTIHLNSIYRKRILGSRPASGADAPLFKTLLFLLVQDDLDSGKVSKQQKARLELLDQVLQAATKALPPGGG